MAIKQFKPYTPGRRFMTVQKNDDLTKKDPERSLLEPLHKKGGRNNRGRITMRHRGGGARRLYRVIDFKRNKLSVPGKIAAIEYDPTGTPVSPSSITLTAKNGTFWLRRTLRSAIPSSRVPSRTSVPEMP